MEECEWKSVEALRCQMSSRAQGWGQTCQITDILLQLLEHKFKLLHVQKKYEIEVIKTLG